MTKDTESNPWTFTDTREIYENPWIALTEHTGLNPAGHPGLYGIVEFKNLAIGVVPYENGDIWLVGQYRVPLGRYSWEIPEGGGPKGEDPLDTAKRELKEETGLSAVRYQELVRTHLSNSVTDEYGVVFLATGLSKGTASPEDTECLQVKRVSLETAFADVENGVITDSLTIMAIYKLMLLKSQGQL